MWEKAALYKQVTVSDMNVSSAILIYSKKLWKNWKNLLNTCSLPTFKKMLFHIKVLKNCFKDEPCISNSIFKIFGKSDSTLGIEKQKNSL